MTDDPDTPITCLDGRRLRRLLLGGIARLGQERGHLDRINVFPVADGDTGTNLTLTFAAIAERLTPLDTGDADVLLAAAADAAIDGARGNSGAIFAQYLNALAEAVTGRHHIDGPSLAQALRAAARGARGALGEPVEGTVLTVMTAMGEAAMRAAGDDLATLLAQVHRSARAAVATTRTTLGVMREAGVEDAGALGMMALLDGMAAALQPGATLPPPVVVEEPLRAHVAPGHDAAPTQRYCTECVIRAAHIDTTALRNALSAIASSVAVVGGAGKARIHAHVDDPGAVFRLAARHGEVSAQKADDMTRQGHALQTGNRRVAIVTDSAADLPEALCDALDIHVVPLRVNFGAHSYLDKAELDGRTFFEQLAASPVAPTTSQPPPGDYRRACELLSSHFEHVVIISLTGRLSGTLQAARTAAARLTPGNRVTVVDSRNGSAGQGLIVLAAAELAARGADSAQVLEAIDGLVGRTRTWALIPDLETTLRGGRIPPRWRWLARSLRVSFLVATTPAGGLRVRGFARRHGDHAGALWRRALADLGNRTVKRAAVAHGDRETAALALAEACRRHFPGLGEIPVTLLGPAIGVHGGPGTLVLALQTSD